MNRKGMIALALAVILASAGAAGGAAFLVLRAIEGNPAATKLTEGERAKGKVVTLSRFLTDLADRDRRRYVDVTMSVLVEGETAALALQEDMPEVRDAVLGYLRSQGASELIGSVGKERLAAALEQVLGPLVPGGVRKVYITDMVVQ